MMKALVMGGNRFFGKRLVSLLLDQGMRVSVLNRGNLRDDFGGKVKHIQMNRHDLSRDHQDLKDDWDVIYDQICYDASEAKKACEVFRDRTGHYVFTSSQSVYGPGAQLKEDLFRPEKHEVDLKIKSNDDYAEAKRQAEAYFSQHAPFPVAMVRFPIVLGPDDYTGRLNFHVDHVRESRPIFFPDINAKMSFVHAKDAAQFLFSLGKMKAVGPVNCCAHSPIALSELMSLIETATQKKAILQDNGDHSPFGATGDWFMNVDKMRSMGFEADPLSNWLPGLIEELV